MVDHLSDGSRRQRAPASASHRLQRGVLPDDQPASRRPDPRAALCAALCPRADRQPAARRRAGRRQPARRAGRGPAAGAPIRASALYRADHPAIRRRPPARPRPRGACRQSSGNCCCSRRWRRCRSRTAAPIVALDLDDAERAARRRPRAAAQLGRDRRAHHRGRADHRDGHRGAGAELRPPRRRRRRQRSRGGGDRRARPARADPGRHQPRRRRRRHQRGRAASCAIATRR